MRPRLFLNHERALERTNSVWSASGGMIPHLNSLGRLMHSKAVEEFCTKFAVKEWKARDMRAYVAFRRLITSNPSSRR
jgi:hypothetical protein